MKIITKKGQKFQIIQMLFLLMKFQKMKIKNNKKINKKIIIILIRRIKNNSNSNNNNWMKLM